ncbi:hypothetical protein FB451DRAFT_1026520, partial [Mycena latifolia]
HGFFTPQLVKDAAVFLLRYILQDWADAQAVVMLRHLRAAALPTTRLVIAEKIVPFASRVDSRSDDIPGASRPPQKLPCSPTGMAVTSDEWILQMHVFFGGVERTLDGFREVLVESGWQLVEVKHCPAGSPLSHLVAAPV